MEKLLVAWLAAALTGCGWLAEAKIVNNNPGLDFAPRQNITDQDNNLIFYKLTDKDDVSKWTSRIDQFLEPYRTISTSANGSANNFNCSPQNPAPPGKFCDVNMRAFQPCVPENHYSYDRSTPCVFLHIDKLLNWKPQPYNTTENLPSDMPEGLKQHIANVAGGDDANTVWVSCDGETPADMEFIGPVHYLPMRGFPAYYFPYTGQEGYLSPLVAVHFERPRLGILINVACTAWARNIARDVSQKMGSVHFELLLD